MDLIKRYKSDSDGMEKGKETEARGIEERDKFLSIYPIEIIPNLTKEQYTSGTDSFSYWLHNRLNNVANIKGVSKNHFEVYTKIDTGSKIHLSRSYKAQFDSDDENAFIYLKNEIVNFLEDISQENYNNFKKYKINSILKNMLMVVYFYDRFVPVCTEPKINNCLERVNISLGKNATMVEKNLALVKWKKDVPVLVDWSNQMALDFCDWLIRKNINIKELCNNEAIETAKK